MMLLHTSLLGRSPDDLQRALDEDDRWQEAKRDGLVAAQVLVDAENDDMAYVVATWPNAGLAQKTPGPPQLAGEYAEVSDRRVVAYSLGASE